MKTKVLEKAFRILESAVTGSPEALTLSKMMELSGLNRQTCARLIADLTEMGYLEHAGPRKGFRAGARAFLLGRRVRYETELRKIAEPYVRETAERLGTFVTLSKMDHGLRYNLLECNGCLSLSLDLRPLGNNDLAFTASGHVLLAWMEREEREALLEKFPEILNRPSFMRTVFCDPERRTRYLEEVRRNGSASLLSEWWGITAVPLFRDGKCVAALASARPAEFVTEEKRRVEQDFLMERAREINRRLDLE